MTYVKSQKQEGPHQPLPSKVVMEAVWLFGVVLVHSDPKGPPPRYVPL